MITRESIILEIKRLAEENSGNAPGWRLFRSHTGLSESAWRGRFWARWGDALLEAGFEPNKKSRAYKDEELFFALIRVARDIGHVPTSPEYKMAVRANPELPGLSAVTRLGVREEYLRKLEAFVAGKPKYSDIAGMLASLEPTSLVRSIPNETAGESDGFVYLIKSGRHFKIGRSNAFGRREREIALQLPEAAKTLHVIRTDDPVGIEAYWHKRFADKRKNGEWFELKQSDVSAFKRRKFM